MSKNEPKPAPGARRRAGARSGSARRRRQAGEGSIVEYSTKAGPRFLIKYVAPLPDGTPKGVLRRGFLTRREAAEALRKELAAVDKGTHVAPSRITVEEHMNTWLAALRKEPSTIESYRRNVRLHVTPYIGDVKLTALTGLRLSALYRTLEASGRRDSRGGGLGPRTVRYVHTIIHAALEAALEENLLTANPASRAKPPTPKQARAPEMRTWTAEELAAFLAWAQVHRPALYPLWLLLAMTGMRRGEVVGLRWGDIDFTARTMAIRRSVVLIKTRGEGEHLILKPPKSGRARVVDLDERTLRALQTHRSELADVSLALAHADAFVFGRLTGDALHPERLSRTFNEHQWSAVRRYGLVLPEIRLHDLRHTHATLYLTAGIHPKIVSERLGHANVSITLDVYSHAVPTLQREAASQVADLIFGPS